jgi:hypothetical protein
MNYKTDKFEKAPKVGVFRENVFPSTNETHDGSV